MDLVRVGLEQEGAGDWPVRVDSMWCSVYPPAHHMRDQGWKLHVAATASSAAKVLERSLPVLARHGCAFKVASTLEFVTTLNSRHYERGSAGKFMTIYPEDDEQFCRLAEELDAVTAGLPGPAILSDRPYRPDSLVHYRYGAFRGRVVLSNDSDYKTVLVGPDGSLVEDRRDAWYNPPPWAPSPFGEPEAQPEAAQAGTATAKQVLLADRFLVRQAIRHANKGGVYVATDTRTEAEVVIKEARPYVESDGAGLDVRDGVRHEAEVLDLLAPLGVAPRMVEVFEQDGHVFLAEEFVPGVPLSRWVGSQEQPNGAPGLPWPLAATLARQLADVLAVVHSAGLVLRDFTPNNVMVTLNGELRLIDLELAAPPGAKMHPGGTRGFAAPEQLVGAAPAMNADLFSLGAVIFFLATGIEALFLDDDPPVRSLHARLEHWLDTTAACSEAARRLAPLVLGLTQEAPGQRWDLERVRAFLDVEEHAPATALADEPQPVGRRLEPSDHQRLIEDGLEYLLISMTPDAQDRLWPSTCWGAATDPCNMYHGAAGVISVLTLAAQLDGRQSARGDASDFSERLRDRLRIAGAWVEQRLPVEPLLLPGLHFGRSGTAWALFDAAQVLGDEPMAARAVAFAKRIPITWPNPDVTHGAAGAGLAQLYLWQATGDAEFYQRVQRCADGLVATATRRPDGTVWTVPASFDSRFAGSTYYGFAHGLAGIAWFLLAAGLAADRDDCLELARAAGNTLCAAARHDGERATWGEGPHDKVGGFVHWCHGSSGIGTFLVRLWQATGDERYRELAEMAAVAAWRARWLASPCVCHGLAGNGDFLLDMAAALDEPRYHAWAEELAAVIFARRAYRDGRMVVPDDTRTDLVADYGVGLAGVIAFLLRLRHGGSRMWMAEPEALAAVGAAR